MASLLAAFVVMARRFAALAQRGYATYSIGTGVAFLALGATGMAVGDWRYVAVAVVLGWGWASLTAARIRADLTTHT